MPHVERACDQHVGYVFSRLGGEEIGDGGHSDCEPHLSLAEDLIGAPTLFLSETERVRALSINPEERLETIKEEVAPTIQEIDHGDGVLILTDVMGGDGHKCMFCLHPGREGRSNHRGQPSHDNGSSARSRRQDVKLNLQIREERGQGKHMYCK
jgi:hypothetical protein